jgi:hypothetical protein
LCWGAAPKLPGALYYYLQGHVRTWRWGAVASQPDIQWVQESITLTLTKDFINTILASQHDHQTKAALTTPTLTKNKKDIDDFLQGTFKGKSSHPYIMCNTFFELFSLYFQT